MIYRLCRNLLFLLPAEAAHRVGFAALRLVQWVPGVRAIVSRLCRLNDPQLVTHALGLTFANPLGVAAGFDKDALAYDALGALGFGFVEVGTLTPRPQPGNAKPRLFRLPADRALINRLGFNNHGARAAVARLQRRRHVIVGVNIGRNKSTAEGDALGDYVAGAAELGPVADYLVVNVSSPNTPGLRNLQATDQLRPLLQAVRAELDRVVPGRHVPLLVKIAPDLADQDIDAIADLSLELGLDGIIATNTTIQRTGLRTAGDRVSECGQGGLSGAPLKERALTVLRRLRARVGDRVVLVSVGGIESSDDAEERLAAGATLLQSYTGFIYGGPGFAGRVLRGLSRHRHPTGAS